MTQDEIEDRNAALLEALERLRTDFPAFAVTCLRIRTKSGAVVPFEINEAQELIHARLEEQRAKTGKVRAIILKGRQQGASTYIAARFYWKTALQTGKRTVVMTHESDSTDALFAMVERYHEHMPEDVKPATRAANAKELMFDGTDSGYGVATAGNKATKRGHTIQYFHGSEVASWANASEHMAGIGQTVPDEDGTEIVLESTAKGMGNMFHLMCMAALAGTSEYQLIFVPWFLEAKYRRPVPDDWQPTPEEAEIAALHGLDDEQLAWRRNKINSDFAGDATKFYEEYPSTPQEAFQAEKRDTFIKLAKVLAARRYVFGEPPHGPLVVGVDPARFGEDRTGFAWRKGRKVARIMAKSKLSTMQVVGLVVDIIRRDKPRKVFIDVIGIGAGVVDRLWELGYEDIVVAVNVSEVADEPERWHRKRDEVWGRMRDWLEAEPVSIPDHDAIQQDLLQPGFSYASDGSLIVESKKDIKKRGAPSPDLADAIALTFAQMVSEHDVTQTQQTGSNVVGDPVGGY